MTIGIVCVDANLVVLLLSRSTLALRVRELWNQWLELNYTMGKFGIVMYSTHTALRGRDRFSNIKLQKACLICSI